MIDKDISKMIESAMIKMTIEYPIYSQLLCKFGVKIVEDDENHIAWTTGKEIVLNATRIKYYNDLKTLVREDTGETVDCTITKDNILFLLAHELGHIMFLTFDRNKHIDPRFFSNKIWNWATDYEINSLLINNKDEGRTKSIGSMPKFGGLYDVKYIDMTAEQIYDELLNDVKDALKESLQNKSSQESGSNENTGGCPIDLPEALQELLEKDNIEDIKGSYKDKDGNKVDVDLDSHDKTPDISDMDKEMIKAKVNDVLQNFGSTTNGLGDTAFGRIFSEMFKPQPFNWKKALSKYIRGYMKDNYTWNKRNRSGISNNLILPAAGQTPCLNIGVAIDTSGSISEKEIDAMLNHLYTILHQFKSFEIDVWSCGSKVYEESLLHLTRTNKKDIRKFKAVSDGGNDMRKNFPFIASLKKKPDVLIIMSDFYDPLDGDTETTSVCPVVYLCLDHKDFTKPTKINGVVYPFEVGK